MEVYRAVVKALPKTRFEFLRYLVKFMVDISACKEENLMDSQNVAKIFASLLLGSLENDLKKEKDLDPMMLYRETTETSLITQLFIDHFDVVFDGPPIEPRIYRAVDAFNPTSKSYMKIVKGDIVMYVRDTASGCIVVIDQNVGEIPNSVLASMKPTKFTNLRVNDVSVVLAKKQSETPFNKR